MTTFFDFKDLISFGNYLLSEKRKELLQQSYDQAVKDGMKAMPVEEKEKNVTDADIENWLDSL